MIYLVMIPKLKICIKIIGSVAEKFALKISKYRVYQSNSFMFIIFRLKQKTTKVNKTNFKF